MTARVDMLCKHIAADLQCALSEVADNFGARLVVNRSRNAAAHLEGAISSRAELLVMQDDAHAVAACRRAFDLICWVDDYVFKELQRRLDAALDESVSRHHELKALRDQVDRAARSVLATTHNSRRRT
jgi:hypothetical protein